MGVGLAAKFVTTARLGGRVSAVDRDHWSRHILRKRRCEKQDRPDNVVRFAGSLQEVPSVRSIQPIWVLQYVTRHVGFSQSRRAALPAIMAAIEVMFTIDPLVDFI